MKKFNTFRLVAGGCIFGIAVASVVADLLGLGSGTAKDVIGAVVGGGSTAIAIKCMHLV